MTNSHGVTLANLDSVWHAVRPMLSWLMGCMVLGRERRRASACAGSLDRACSSAVRPSTCALVGTSPVSSSLRGGSRGERDAVAARSPSTEGKGALPDEALGEGLAASLVRGQQLLALRDGVPSESDALSVEVGQLRKRCVRLLALLSLL